MGINISVALRDGENQEKLIKRFFKKCKKENIINEYLDKTSHHLTKSQKKRKKRMLATRKRELLSK